MKFYTLLICLGVLCTSCKVKTQTGNPQSNQYKEGYTDIPQQSQMQEEAADNKVKNCVTLVAEETKVDSTFIEAQILKYRYDEGCVCLEYAYSGCGETEATVYWEKSKENAAHNPPKARIKVLLKDPGLCEAYFINKLCFSTEKLKLSGNEMLLQFKEKDQNLLLQFQY